MVYAPVTAHHLAAIVLALTELAIYIGDTFDSCDWVLGRRRPMYNV